MEKNSNKVDDDFGKTFMNDYHKNSKIWGKDSFFFEVSLYTRKIRKYIEKFGKEQVLILPIDIDNEENVIRRLEKFLEIKLEKNNRIDRNESVYARFNRVNSFLCSSGIKLIIRKYVATNILHICKKYYYKSKPMEKNKSEYEISDEVKKMFIEDVSNLSKLIKEPDLPNKWII